MLHSQNCGFLIWTYFFSISYGFHFHLILFVGMRTLSGILAERESISGEMLKILDEATDPWGISVERVELKDVKLPRDLQRAMAAEAEATRDARAKVSWNYHNLRFNQCITVKIVGGSLFYLLINFC